MKAAVVTGAGHGIGRCIVADLAANGYTVLATDRDAQGLAETEKIVNELSASKLVFTEVADLSDSSVPAQLIAIASERFGRIDALVNNAADQTPGGISGTDFATWNRVMAVNVSAPFLLAKAAQDALARTRGAIVLMGSLVGNQPIPDRTAYCTSKAAVAGLGRVMACELGAHGIRVNTVAPGHVMTDGPEVWSQVYSLPQQQAFPLSYPINRVALPEEIARVVTFLLSEASSFITGATITVDGGMSVLCPETAVFRAAGLA